MAKFLGILFISWWLTGAAQLSSKVLWFCAEGGLAPEQHSENHQQPAHTFRLELTAVGLANDGTPLDIRAYKVADGTKLTTVHGHFGSAEAALAELRRTAKKSSRIVEQGEQVIHGISVGERVVAKLAASEPFPERTMVLMTKDADFYQIVSPSAELVFEAEERFYKDKYKGKPSEKAPARKSDLNE